VKAEHRCSLPLPLDLPGQPLADVVTGTKSERDRPQFKRLFELASRREFDIVLFWAPQ